MEVVLLLFLAASGALLAVLALGGARDSGRRREAILAAWREAAADVGAGFEPSAETSVEACLRLSALLGDTRVTARVDGARSTAAFLTRVRAVAEAPRDLRFALRPVEALSPVARAIVRRVAFGDPRFDGRFVVDCDDPDVAEAWLDAPVRGALSATDGYEWSLDHGVVTAVRAGVEDDADALAAAMRAAGELARRGARLKTAWAAVAAEIGGACRGAWPFDAAACIEVETRGVRVTVEVTPAGGAGRSRRLRTRVTASSATTFDAAHRFVVLHGPPDQDDTVLPAVDDDAHCPPGVEVRSSDRGKTLRELTPERWKRIRELAPRRLARTAAAAAIEWDGIELDALRVTGAVELVADLAAAPAQGPYR